MDVITHELEIEGPASDSRASRGRRHALGIHEHVTAGDSACRRASTCDAARDGRRLDRAVAHGARSRGSCGPAAEAAEPEVIGAEPNPDRGQVALRAARERLVVGLGNPGPRVRRNAPQRRLHGRRRGRAPLRHHAGRRKTPRSKPSIRRTASSSSSRVVYEPQWHAGRLISSWYRRRRKAFSSSSTTWICRSGNCACGRSAATADITACVRSSRRSARSFPRIRIGVGRPEYDSVDHVLGRFNEQSGALRRSCARRPMALSSGSTRESTRRCVCEYVGARPTAVDNLSSKHRHQTLGVGQITGGARKNVLREHGQVRELTGFKRTFLGFLRLRVCRAARVCFYSLFACDCFFRSHRVVRRKHDT